MEKYQKAHHRCSACKQESYPRHKYRGMVLCDGCRYGYHSSFSFRGMVTSIWGFVTDVWSTVFGNTSAVPDIQAKQRQVMVAMKQQEKVARRIQRNPTTLNPQKR